MAPPAWLVRGARVMAPMVDQSELAFRLLCRRYNTGVTYTPMFHAKIFSERPSVGGARRRPCARVG